VYNKVRQLRKGGEEKIETKKLPSLTKYLSDRICGGRGERRF